MTDAELLDAFERCTLPASLWTHEAHVCVAWLYLSRSDEHTALHHIRTGIQRFNDSVLKKALAYHETITTAFTRLIAHRKSRLGADDSFAEFKVRCEELLDRKLGALLRHYRKDTLFSDAARERFLEPDLLPLPSPALEMPVGIPQEQDSSAKEYQQQQNQR
jgi:hypothetical protein